jgi:hypothetical protein
MCATANGHRIQAGGRAAIAADPGLTLSGVAVSGRAGVGPPDGASNIIGHQ